MLVTEQICVSCQSKKRKSGCEKFLVRYKGSLVLGSIEN